MNKCLLNFEKLENTTLPIVTLKHNNIKLKMLIDTGSDCTYIDESILDLLLTTPTEEPVGNIVFGSGGADGEHYVHIMPVEIGDAQLTLEVVPVDFHKTVIDFRNAFGVTIRGLLGSDFLSAYGFTLDMNAKVMYINGNTRQTSLDFGTPECPEEAH